MLHELWIVALSESQSVPNRYALILEDTVSKRRIPLIIGVAEAQAIAIPMEKMTPGRPQTHDLLATVIRQLDATVKHVVINRFEQGVFFASVFLEKSAVLMEIDARPSDAIALAVRMGCSIFAEEAIIEQSAYYFDEKTRDKKGSYAEYTLDELEELLKKIIAKEDYESAVRVREAIERRKAGGMS
ncbi:bifunctional nuclease family protein [Arundinibacter roseus]|uniref:Bifunctional nuclease family protein n=1 Tax=Arundinibacter roseus TaxID=2070510 RepID=A0A4R4JZS2_9BACT|nr:bifunctional nuclease family protein [Arundinibacter roseus]TDB60388.1 bifunctional nuclease family protein [Arundinibacter roseus]